LKSEKQNMFRKFQKVGQVENVTGTDILFHNVQVYRVHHR